MLQNHYNGKKEVITLNNYDYSWSQITHQKKYQKTGSRSRNHQIVATKKYILQKTEMTFCGENIKKHYKKMGL